jgi:hypothetical protein
MQPGWGFYILMANLPEGGTIQQPVIPESAPKSFPPANLLHEIRICLYSYIPVAKLRKLGPFCLICILKWRKLSPLGIILARYRTAAESEILFFDPESILLLSQNLPTELGSVGRSRRHQVFFGKIT